MVREEHAVVCLDVLPHGVWELRGRRRPVSGERDAAQRGHDLGEVHPAKRIDSSRGSTESMRRDPVS